MRVASSGILMEKIDAFPVVMLHSEVEIVGLDEKADAAADETHDDHRQVNAWVGRVPKMSVPGMVLRVDVRLGAAQEEE